MPRTNTNPADGDRGVRQTIRSGENEPAENSHLRPQTQAFADVVAAALTCSHRSTTMAAAFRDAIRRARR